MSESVRPPVETDGVKMIYLIRRRPAASREELIMHWFANHMPLVIRAQYEQAEAGRRHARRYIATIFDAVADAAASAGADAARPAWDGFAALWWDRAHRRPAVPHGTEPTDSFQQKAEPYLPWATRELVVLDPAESLGVDPLTLNEPYPCTRSGFCKVTFLVKAREDADIGGLFEHWLQVHAPNVCRVLEQTGGFGYVISHSLEPDEEPFAGMAELYFDDAAGWQRFQQLIEADGMERWVDPRGTLTFTSGTEMVGIP